MNIIDIAKAVAPECQTEIIGIRPGEKLHEQMIGSEDSHFTYEYDDHYKILPSINDWASDKNRIKNGKLVEEGFIYSSDNNKDQMTIEQLQKWIANNIDKIGKI